MTQLLEITDRGQRRYIPRDDMPPAPAPLARPIDLQGLTEAAMTSQADAVKALIAAMTPTTIDGAADYRDSRPAGLATYEETAGRNTRFRWTIAGLTAAAVAATWGVVQIAAELGAIDHAWTVPAWAAAAGLAAIAAIRHVHGQEIAHSPEGVALTEAAATAYATERRADAAGQIAGAFAVAIQDDAAARRANAEAARAANLAAAAPALPAWAAPRREMDYTPRRDPPALPAPDDDARIYAATVPVMPIQRPQPSHSARVAPTAAMPAPSNAGAAAMPADPALLEMIATLRQIYDDAERTGSDLITRALPWAARSRNGWSAAQKAAASKALGYFDPPLIARDDTAGGRYRLDRRWRRRVAELIIAREWATG